MKILVVDDHALVREGLRQVLKGLDDQVEVLDAPNCARAFDLARQHHDIDLVLLDYHLPDMDGLQALAVLSQQFPELPVIILSGSASVQTMQRVIASGAAGFVTKSSLSDELLKVVRLVMDGEIYRPDELPSDCLTATLPDDSGVAQGRQTLTRRQELVLREMLDGRTNRDISVRLNVSEETVKNHVTAVLRHFGVQTRTQAVLAAERLGYTASSRP